MERVRPAAPVAPWLGGKRRLYPQIVVRLEAIEHRAYVEPFVGMGGVFLRRRWRPALEVANDRNGAIVNLFRIIQRHHAYLLDFMRFQLVSRREFDRLRGLDPGVLTDLERAARFLYLQRLAFGGQLGGVFGVSTERARFSLAQIEPLLAAAHDRLDGVVFENLDWSDVLERYDHAGTLFYLDPPYFGNEGDYGAGIFSADQFDVMASHLRTLHGAFVLSINDRPEVREIFAGFDIAEARLTYSISRAGSTAASDLIISNREGAGRLL